MSIAQNISRIRDQIDSAARRVGRDPDSIVLMAVSKNVSTENIRAAYTAGVRVFGESRVQEFSAKKVGLKDLEGSQWHMIGQLQSNKLNKAAELFSGVDSISSLRLAEKLNGAARSIDKTISTLIEINIGGELSKGGMPPNSSELEELLQAAPDLEHLQFRGIMAVPPLSDDSQEARRHFRNLRELRDRIAERSLPAVRMDVLSMGMSHDFEVAIEEGSNCVRIGTAIFGTRS